MAWISMDETDFGIATDKVIRVGITENDTSGKKYLGIRVWYKDGDEWKPGKQGLNIPIEDPEANAKVILLSALKKIGVTQQQIIDEFDFQKIAEGDQS